MTDEQKAELLKVRGEYLRRAKHLDDFVARNVGSNERMLCTRKEWNDSIAFNEAHAYRMASRLLSLAIQRL